MHNRCFFFFKQKASDEMRISAGSSDVCAADLAAPVDGRTLRAMRTREAIFDATFSLIDEGDLRPTAPRVAERAGVSVRSVFQHFDDLESLHAEIGRAACRARGCRYV